MLNYSYHYYVMERAEKTLNDLVRSLTLITKKFFSIYSQILNGIKNIHNFYIHRDIKPQNIYI